MKLFGKKKKSTKDCCCGGNCNTETMQQAEKAKVNGSSIKVLGSGCANCSIRRYDHSCVSCGWKSRRIWKGTKKDEVIVLLQTARGLNNEE